MNGDLTTNVGLTGAGSGIGDFSGGIGVNNTCALLAKFKRGDKSVWRWVNWGFVEEEVEKVDVVHPSVDDRVQVSPSGDF